jgi:Protein of unknown function (DUF1003)
MLLAWVVLNTVILTRYGGGFDPYPYIFLNLILSMVAALQAPVILMSQNRQAARTGWPRLWTAGRSRNAAQRILGCLPVTRPGLRTSCPGPFWAAFAPRSGIRRPRWPPRSPTGRYPGVAYVPASRLRALQVHGTLQGSRAWGSLSRRRQSRSCHHPFHYLGRMLNNPGF